jgi:2-polyprenyl-3-methyl-5-hydroxy-6-metoxy-1,4-benzoquinol methylase
MTNNPRKREDYQSLIRQYADPSSLAYKKLQLVDSHVTTGINLLDFGTGPGELIELEKPKFDTLYGVDSDEESLRICRRRFKNDKKIHIVQSNGTDLTSLFQNTRFDCIAACDVLEHMELKNCVELLATFYHLLDLDGKFVFSGPGIFEKVRIRFGRSPIHIQSHSSYGWLRLIKSAGFQPISVGSVEFPLIHSPVLRKLLHIFGQCCVITARKGRS